MKGKFITFEGGDGAGKTTQISYAKDYLNSCGLSLLLTREPGGTELAEKIRALILNQQAEMTAITEALLMFAARAQHTSEVILPALKKGLWVLCDRYTDASFAYQGGGRGLADEVIADLEKIATDSLQPDLTLLLDLEVEEGVSRSHARGAAADRFESEALSFKAAIRAAYLRRQSLYPHRIKLIDAARPATEVHGDIVEYIERLRVAAHG